MATIDDFHKLDIRVGKIIRIEDFPEAKKPAYKLTIDFGSEIGIKQSSAQLVKNYSKESLKGKLVLGVVNFPQRKIGPLVSEVLTLGVPDGTGECILVVPDKTFIASNLKERVAQNSHGIQNLKASFVYPLPAFNSLPKGMIRGQAEN